MMLTNLLSELDKLNRADKLRVIQHLARELEVETSDELDTKSPIAGSLYEVWSPQDAGGAVNALHQALDEYRQNKRDSNVG